MRFFLALLLYGLIIATPSRAADLIVEDLTEGTGPVAEEGAQVAIHYTGWLADGTKIDSSIPRGRPAQFFLGQAQVIRGWDEGVTGMRVGGKRKLTVPPEFAYGERGAGQVIPPNATLVFEVELLQVRVLNYSIIGNDRLKVLMAEGVAIVDVRRLDEWQATGVIPGAQRLTAYDAQGRFNPDFIASLKQIAGPDDPVVLICRTGGRSTKLSEYLSGEAGYTAVHNHRGGMMRWLMFSGTVESCCD